MLPVTRSGQRLDQFLVEQVETLSRGRAQQLIQAGHVLVLRGQNDASDRRQARPSRRLQAGEIVRVEFPALQTSALEPELMPLSVVYEDDDMLVIDKPAGLAVHPAPGHERGTLVHALLARYPDLPGINGTQRPGIVHRLDLNTSGLLMVAKNERAQHSLAAQLAEHRVSKGYLALASGRLEPPRGVIDAPVGRDPSHRKRMAVTRGGRASRTRYFSLGALSGRSLLLVVPESGRTHQIRVHLAAIGHPIAGDPLYGGEAGLVARQFLHAARLRFARPSDAARIEVESALPPDLMQALWGLIEARDAAPPEGSPTAMLELACALFQELAAPPGAGEPVR